MDRKTIIGLAAIVVLAACAIVNYGFRRTIVHRDISGRSFDVIGSSSLDAILVGTSEIKGEAWRTSEGEFGYFSARISEEDIAALVAKFTAKSGVQLKHSTTDRDSLESKWNAIFRQFTKNAIPIRVEENEEIHYYRWNSGQNEGELAIQVREDKTRIYLTWYKHKR